MDPAHEHVYRTTWQRIPLPDGYHTEFYILRCDCGAVDVFPSANYLLTPAVFQAAFALGVRAVGGTFLLRVTDDTRVRDAD